MFRALSLLIVLWESMIWAQSERPANTYATETIIARPPAFFAISTPDPAALARWYQLTFGLAVLKQAHLAKDRTIWIVGSESLRVEIGPLFGDDSQAVTSKKRDPRAIARGIFKVGFSVDDLPALKQRMKKAGVSFLFENGMDEELGEKFTIIMDPDGNAIQIFERKIHK